MTLTRRRALTAASVIVPAALLAACGTVATTTTNGVTTVTVNTASIDAWGAAFVNAAGLISTLPGLVGTPSGAAIAAVQSIVRTDLAAFDKATGGALSLAFDSTSVPASVASLLTDGRTLLAASAGAMSGVSATYVQTAQTYLSAISVIVGMFEAALAVAQAIPMGAGQMSEKQALATLGVK